MTGHALHLWRVPQNWSFGAAHADLRSGIIYLHPGPEFPEANVPRLLVHEALHLILNRLAGIEASSGLDALDGGWDALPHRKDWRGREARITGGMAGIARMARLPVLAPPARTREKPRRRRERTRHVSLESCRFAGCECCR